MTGPEQRTATLSGPVTGGRGWAFGSPADAAAYGYLRAWDAAVDRAHEQGLVLDTDLAGLRERGRKIVADLF